jgi:pyruvate-ferredoxin/flavodoxin oxidoreductase
VCIQRYPLYIVSYLSSYIRKEISNMRKLKTMDGNTAAAHVAYAFTEVAAIYPITPSSPMAESIDEWSANGRKNVFGEPVKVVEMQAEGGAAGAVHGSVVTGSYTSTFTASQGLLLMIPNMYKIAGEHKPAVFHVSARALASHALSIFGDQADVMAVRQTGFTMICSNSVQQVMDLGAVAHLTAIGGKLPVLHYFDGFRTSHENQKIEMWDYDELAEMVDWDKVKEFKDSVLHPMNPYSMGPAEQPESYFQHREASNTIYVNTPDLVKKYMDMVNEKIGTNYKPFNFYGAEDAESIIVAMGSVCEAAEELVDKLNEEGKKVGILEVHLYRPFSPKYMLEVLPKTVKKIAVLDRTKEPGSIGEPLYLDVVAALRGTQFEDCLITRGRYGLGSKDVQPGDILAVYENLEKEEPKEEFTISINDDVTHLSLTPSHYPNTAPEGTVSCKFWGLGSDGTVGANKNSVKIIGDHTDKKVQAYFQYDSKKSGGVTISHLRFGDKPIQSTYYVKQADFVACHNEAYVHLYKMVEDVKPGKYFLLNCTWSDEELDKHLPASMKRYIAQNDIQFYTCDAVDAAKRVGLGARRTNTVLQAAFFKLTNIIPIEDAEKYMKDAIKKTYAAKGDNIVKMNMDAVDEGLKGVHKVNVPSEWADCQDDEEPKKMVGRDEAHTKYLNEILYPYTRMDGDSIPVSAFVDTSTGAVPNGNAAYEKRGIATDIPVWDKEKCIQCTQCSYVCPHAVIRPFVLDKDEADKIGNDVQKMRGKGMEDKFYTISISAFDCTGCGSCADVCPAPGKALVMTPVSDELLNSSQDKFDFCFEEASSKEVPFKESTVKGTQFKQPLLEFSGACPGCGESPYAKLVTQLFGDRMLIANATGCTSIWGNSLPSTPYTVNKEGRGPAWANSLFEDNAEFGYGMAVSIKTRRNEMRTRVEKLVSELGNTAQDWIDGMNDADLAEEKGKALLEACKKIQDKNEDTKYVVDNSRMLIKPSVWIFGGDGWAYDIGYGGLDHVLASGENVNVLVFDTEVYSNTGGQSSKSTPMGAVAKFASAGKSVKKKDMVQIMMAYGYVYVAQIAMGANQQQTLNAIREAEAYDGPSLIIAYAPCINHGVKAGMNKSMEEMKKAVDAGYWHLVRFNPELAEEGKNPLIVDSKEPTGNYRDFIMGEVRYNSLTKKFPERAEKLFTEAEEQAKERYERLKTLEESFEKDVEE